MALPRSARPSLDGTDTRPLGRIAHGALGLLFTLVALSVAASMACRGHDGLQGTGGQSGDEGRRPRPSWLGTGGVAAEPAITR